MEKSSIVCLVLFFITLSASFSQGGHGHHSASKPRSQITVIGTVYCDICSNNTFSRHSYFLPGVEVKVDCKFKATAARAAEEITFSVSRTTNEYGWYKLEIPSVDGIECARGATVESVCRASLVGSSTSKCNVPGYTTTTDVVYFKSSQQNICIYGLSALNFRPSRKNKDLCAN
ncbi:uncharacterized protein LOC104895230 [Beta vulgaris subsp. vulgaris]|uniref:uncharacterized protein LOC104895230 n=1 Tax=Beta vulgaris subsp. vulgaris TaxID=3555 RepID=UPI002036704A|nr:uncharacterized protein LOC104895230 [Beta vulgaris subsp. vulgaris]